VILVVPFLIYGDITIIQNEEPITKYSLPWLKKQLCLTGDGKYGSWFEGWLGGGGGYRSGRM
jgi:hypothetical protein